MLTIDMLKALWPHADGNIATLNEAIAGAAPTVFPAYGLTSDLLIAHAMAQFSEECGAGTQTVENLDYSAQGLINTWPTRFNATNAATFANQPQLIANEVYNGRMGNAPDSNDGWNFRGRGASQVTGRSAYTTLGTTLGLDLGNSPDLVNDPAQFLACAVADFVQCGCLPFAVNDDVNGVTYHLNGGYNGLNDRIAWLAKWKSALNVAGATDHSTIWIQQSLNQLGADPALSPDGSYGPLTVAAVKSFQQSNGLTVDGKAGPLTIAALETALGG